MLLLYLANELIEIVLIIIRIGVLNTAIIFAYASRLSRLLILVVPGTKLELGVLDNREESKPTSRPLIEKRAFLPLHVHLSMQISIQLRRLVSIIPSVEELIKDVDPCVASRATQLVPLAILLDSAALLALLWRAIKDVIESIFFIVLIVIVLFSVLSRFLLRH